MHSCKAFIRHFMLCMFFCSTGLLAKSQTIYYVDISKSATGDGLSWATACSDLQLIINTASSSNSDQVWVAKGIYVPNRRADALTTITVGDANNAFVLKNNIKIYGGFAGTETSLSTRNLALTDNISTLNGNFDGTTHCYHVVIGAGGVGNAVLDGFTVTGGKFGSGSITVNNIAISQAYGAGICNYNSSPTINNLTISGNHSSYGGGISNYNYSSPIINNVTISGNIGSYGSGIFNFNYSSPTISNATINANTASAGIYNRGYSSPTIINSSISYNISGGGIYNFMYCNPTILNCKIIGNYSNTTGSGGGITNVAVSSITATNVLIVGNSSNYNGGGIFNNSGCNAILTNATISGNFTGANGGGIYTNSNLTISNSIVYNNYNTNSGVNNIYNPTGTIVSKYSLIQGATDITNGNISTTDPLFIAPMVLSNPNSEVTYNSYNYTLNPINYRLQSCSPAINNGSNTFYAIGQTPNLSAIVTDVDGNPRIAFATVDMGAYEDQSNMMGINGDISTIASIPIAGTTAFAATASACHSMLSITPLGGSGTLPITGRVSGTLWIDATVSHSPANAMPYVQRHYEITPSTNAATATAQVTLYYTQADFDAYNADPKIAVNMGLPTGPNDATGGIARFRIFQYHGISTGGTGTPASYTDPAGTVDIDPADNSIVWNSTMLRWEVSFPVTGFSGFYAGTENASILPVQLVSFTAKKNNDNTVAVQWQVAQQVAMKQYIVERGNNGASFTAIASIAANDNTNSYAYTDAAPLAGVIAYYRLQTISQDGTISYSEVVAVNNGNNTNNTVTAYPNPATDQLWLNGNAPTLLGTEATLTDMQGRTVLHVTISQWPQRISTTNLAPGIYLLHLLDNSFKKIMIER